MSLVGDGQPSEQFQNPVIRISGSWKLIFGLRMRQAKDLEANCNSAGIKVSSSRRLRSKIHRPAWSNPPLSVSVFRCNAGASDPDIPAEALLALPEFPRRPSTCKTERPSASDALGIGPGRPGVSPRSGFGPTFASHTFGIGRSRDPKHRNSTRNLVTLTFRSRPGLSPCRRCRVEPGHAPGPERRCEVCSGRGSMSADDLRPHERFFYRSRTGYCAGC
jgi:hypothetical protein